MAEKESKLRPEPADPTPRKPRFLASAPPPGSVLPAEFPVNEGDAGAGRVGARIRTPIPGAKLGATGPAPAAGPEHAAAARASSPPVGPRAAAPEPAPPPGAAVAPAAPSAPGLAPSLPPPLPPGPSSPATPPLPIPNPATVAATAPKAAPDAATAAALERLDAAVRTLQELGARLYGEARADALEVGFLVARRLLDAEVRASPEPLFRLVRSALQKVGEARPVTLRLHPDDAHRLTPGAPGAPSLVDVQVLGDPALARGDVVIDAEFGSVDARLDTRLAELRRSAEGALTEEES